MNLSKLKKEGRREFEEKFSHCFNIGVITDKITEANLKNFQDAQIEKAYSAGRSDALDEEYDKAEELGEVAKANYSQGYNDCKKGRKPAPHETRGGYCCACDYDLACFEADKKKVYQQALSDVEKGLGKTLTQKIDKKNFLKGWEKHWIPTGNSRYIERCIECQNSDKIIKALFAVKEVINKLKESK